MPNLLWAGWRQLRGLLLLTSFDEALAVYYPLLNLFRAALPDGRRMDADGFLIVASAMIATWILLLYTSSLFRVLPARARNGWSLLVSQLFRTRGLFLEDSTSYVLGEHLTTVADVGLTRDEVQERRKRYGYNEMVSPRMESWNDIKTSLRPCFDTHGVPLGVTFLFSLLQRRWLNAALAVLSFVWRAYAMWSRAVDIQDPVSPWGKGFDRRYIVSVVRESMRVDIPSRELVPGDIIILGKGQSKALCQTPPLSAQFPDRQPIMADCRLLFAKDLVVDQSTIFGESLCVTKQAGNTVFYRTLIVSGEALAVVLCSARRSNAGQSIIQAGETQPALPNRTMTGVPARQNLLPYDDWEAKQFAQAVSVLTTTAYASVLLTALVRGEEYRSNRLTFLFAMLAIIHQPWTSTGVINGMLAKGSSKIAETGGILQLFTRGTLLLARIDTLCCDRFGFLSQNRPVIKETFAMHCTLHELMLAVGLSLPAVDAKIGSMDRMLRQALGRYPMADAQVNNYTLVDEESSDAHNFMACTRRRSPHGEIWTCGWGALSIVANLCLVSADDRRELKKQASEFGHSGLRVMAVARQKQGSNSGWQCLGLLAFDDPPRSDSRTAIEQAWMLGVDVKMLTTDIDSIAEKAALEYSPSWRTIVNAREAYSTLDSLSSHAQELFAQANVFAESSDHKREILGLLQRTGRVVAVTGSDHADNPSLHQADCGIGVEGCTVDAQTAADIVFVQPGLSKVVACVRISRQTFHKIQTWHLYQTIIALQLTFSLIWTLWRARDVSSHAWVITGSVLLRDMAGIYFAHHDGSIFCPRKPYKWSVRRLLATIGVWTSVSVLSTALLAVIVPVASDPVVVAQPTIALAAAATYYWHTKHGNAFVAMRPEDEAVIQR